MKGRTSKKRRESQMAELDVVLSEARTVVFNLLVAVDNYEKAKDEQAKGEDRDR